MPVNLQHALTWHCPDCAHVNVLGKFEVPEDLVKEIKEEFELADSDEILRIPDFVFCRKCEAKHEIADPEGIHEY